MQKPDVFDPVKEYVFVNTSDSEFRCKYGNPEFNFVANPKYSSEENRRLYDEAYKREGVKEIVLAPGGMYQCKEWLGFHLMKHFVDREIIRQAERDYGPLSRNAGENKGNANTKADDVILNMNSVASREQFENGCLKLIKTDEESPIVQKIREEERAKVTDSIRQEERAKAQQEFAGINQIAPTDEFVVAKGITPNASPAPVMPVEAPKRGRPAKHEAPVIAG